jgi:hypothetical protein
MALYETYFAPDRVAFPIAHVNVDDRFEGGKGIDVSVSSPCVSMWPVSLMEFHQE